MSRFPKRLSPSNPNFWYEITGLALILVSAFAGVYVVAQCVIMWNQVFAP